MCHYRGMKIVNKKAQKWKENAEIHVNSMEGNSF
jgi:hypothetical protein